MPASRGRVHSMWDGTAAAVPDTAASFAIRMGRIVKRPDTAVSASAGSVPEGTTSPSPLKVMTPASSIF